MKLKVIASEYLEGLITATECRDKIVLSLADMNDPQDIADCMVDLCTAIYEWSFGVLQA